jgi:hypothetical protein
LDALTFIFGLFVERRAGAAGAIRIALFGGGTLGIADSLVQRTQFDKLFEQIGCVRTQLSKTLVEQIQGILDHREIPCQSSLPKFLANPFENSLANVGRHGGKSGSSPHVKRMRRFVRSAVHARRAGQRMLNGSAARRNI